MIDYRKYYNLEQSVFVEIKENFERNKHLTAVEFFMIVSWKSNRPKPRIAKWLILNCETGSLDTDVVKFTTELSKLKDEQLLAHLVSVDGIGLAMASAILSVLYPDKFTIYDYRVCEILNNHKTLGDRAYGIKSRDSEKALKLWEGYKKFIKDVDEFVDEDFSLRDKDRYLWGKSFYEQLKEDVENKFKSKE